ncbi:MAG: SsrA-binding protein [Candidatus Cloacimonetes bacterium HGW-Cloacimonetes-1]|jgi:SsrA-binding protein|nr:MAG: SsrA-binding protein [Candidatus Cloacimonetes bacterium HGW-Cloacimonetes-1]
MKSIKNRKALHEYFVIQQFEAGIVLRGTEIKSIRAGQINFKDSYAKIENGECWLMNFHISPWEKASFFNHEAERKRKLLMHRSEIRKLKSKVEELGMTLIPLDIYINAEGLCKLSIALCKGKKFYDKRETLHKKDLEREREREK